MEPVSLISAIILFTALIFLTIFFLIIMYALVFGIPYAPLAENRIATMSKLLKLKKGQNMIDMGSGDGRILIKFAKNGVKATGYEINPVLIALSRLNIRKAGVSDKAKVEFQDFWSADVSKADAIAIYGISYIMGRMEKKLKKECKKGTKVVVNYFKFPNLKPKKIENKVLYYEI